MKACKMSLALLTTWSTWVVEDKSLLTVTWKSRVFGTMVVYYYWESNGGSSSLHQCSTHSICPYIFLTATPWPIHTMQPGNSVSTPYQHNQRLCNYVWTLILYVFAICYTTYSCVFVETDFMERSLFRRAFGGKQHKLVEDIQVEGLFIHLRARDVITERQLNECNSKVYQTFIFVWMRIVVVWMNEWTFIKVL